MENQDSLPTRSTETTAERAGDTSKGQNLMIPGAIILAGIIIAGAVVYSNGSASTVNLGDTGQAAIRGNVGAAENVKPVTKDDHIIGSIDALVTIIEFSDLECPFCKRFHSTLQQIVDEYDGKVAWVYRHFPLDSLHSKARKEAEATECAANLGGNNAFWAYTNRLFEVTPSNNRLDLDSLPEIAEYIGLDKEKFQKCLDSGQYKDHIASDLEDAFNSGGQGTPYSIVISADGTKSVIPGALSYDSVKKIIDEALGTK